MQGWSAPSLGVRKKDAPSRSLSCRASSALLGPDASLAVMALAFFATGCFAPAPAALTLARPALRFFPAASLPRATASASCCAGGSAFKLLVSARAALRFFPAASLSAAAASDSRFLPKILPLALSAVALWEVSCATELLSDTRSLVLLSGLSARHHLQDGGNVLVAWVQNGVCQELCFPRKR